jgi:hypothetical protein
VYTKYDNSPLPIAQYTQPLEVIMHIANNMPKSKTINLHYFYAKIDAALNIIYAQEDFFVNDIQDLLRIKNGLDVLSSIFETEIHNRVLWANTPSILFNPLQAKKITHEIDVIQGLESYNHALDEEIDDLLDNVLFLLPPITLVLQ